MRGSAKEEKREGGGESERDRQPEMGGGGGRERSKRRRIGSGEKLREREREREIGGRQGEGNSLPQSMHLAPHLPHLTHTGTLVTLSPNPCVI